MESKTMVSIAAVAAAAGALLFVRPTLAETINCNKITSLPAVISAQGVYCMDGHISTNLASGAAVTVNVNNVIIDCNEYKIGNLQAGSATEAVGIQASGRLNVTVRNCGIRGFRTGVQMTNGQYWVQDNRMDNNWQIAVDVSGDGSAVRRNEIVDTGGSTAGSITAFLGIRAAGDLDVIDNAVSGVAATSGSGASAYGIFTDGVDGGTISRNRVRGLAADGLGANRGIWNTGGGRTVVEGNTVVLNGNLLIGEAGIRCGDNLVLNGASRNNTVLGTGVINTALGLINCTAATGNFVNPL